MENIKKRHCTIYLEHIEGVRAALSDAEQLEFYNALFDYLAYGKEPNLQGRVFLAWAFYSTIYINQRESYEEGVKRNIKTNPFR